MLLVMRFFSHGEGISETTLLKLQEAYSLSALMYASAALTLHSKQISELNACWNNVIRKIFGYQRWESVKGVIYGLGRLNVAFEFLVRRVKFYKRMYLVSWQCVVQALEYIDTVKTK